MVLYSLVSRLDRLGLRPLIARVAKLAYPGHRFFVDGEGRWVNQQAGGTIVSPVPHTISMQSMQSWVFDNWCYRYWPQPSDVIVDCGAGVGEEALILSRTVSKVISIEAHPGFFGCLQETIRRSKLKNVEAVRAAVADRAGTAKINDARITSSIMRDGTVEVPQIAIADLELPRIDFLRMNIEGAEKLAIHGVPWDRVRNAVISCHDFAGLPSKKEVRAVLRREGFKVETRPSAELPWVREYLYATRPL